MECLKFIVDTMCGNLQEAQKYAGMIVLYRENHKDIADWCKDMATSHITFNVNGIATAKKIMHEIRTETTENAEFLEGALSVWNERLAEISIENLRIKAMLDNCK